MNFDRSDYEESEQSRRKPASDEVTRLRMIQQSAVRAEIMTGDQAWDTYLSYLQASIDQSKKNRDGFMRQLASPQMVNPDHISLARISVIRLEQQIAALEWAIALPIQIKKLGEVAKEQLDSLAAIEVQQWNPA